MSLFLLLLACSGSEKPSLDTPSEDSHALSAVTGLGTIEARGLILIQVDTLRADHLGAYGYERETTPTLTDWLRVEGLSSTSSWTPLSTASLLTSLPPYAHGVRYFVPAETAMNATLHSPTWASALEATGVRAMVASGSNFISQSTGFLTGFTLGATEGKTWPDNNMTTLSGHVLGWLDTLPAEQPFFVFIHVMNTHDPYFAPAESENTWSDGSVPFSPNVDSSSQQAQIRTAFAQDPNGTRQAVIDVYDDQILGLDMALAALEDGLSARGLLDQSLLVLTADHGETLGDRDSAIFGHGNDLPQEQLRIPLLMKNPQLTPAVLDCVASNMDTMPTLIRMMGWEAHVEAQGLALQDGCRSITQSELYGDDGSLSYISASNKNYRLVRACQNGSEIAHNLESNPDGSQLIDPNSVPEIDSLRLSLDTYGDAIQAATGSGCVSLY